jgi:TolA-binding protein
VKALSVDTIKNSVLNLGALLFLGLVLASCAKNIKRDIVNLENSVDDFRVLYSEQSAKFQEIEANFKTLQTRIEQIEYNQKKTLGDEVSSLRSALSTLKKRVPPPIIVPEEALESAEASAKALPKEISSLVTTALSALREGSFNEALQLLETALEKSSGQNFMSEIMFWIGVCYDGLEDNRKALLAYHRIISFDDKSQLASAALLRQAFVFSRMQDKDSYDVTLKKLIASYPKSLEAKEAHSLLNEESGK